MITAEVERLWEEYLAAERVCVRQESMGALERFIEALLQLSSEVWHPWARGLAQRVVDEGDEIPVRFPLFRSVLFPALLAGVEKRLPGAARCLAGFAQVLYKSPSCLVQLPENLRSEYDLLERAIQDDPSDAASKLRLLKLMRSRFDYVLHELPAGVLYGHDGATLEECDELLNELYNYERLAAEVGAEEEDRELIADARFHIPAYQRYLQRNEGYRNYEEFLSVFKRA
ncbi:hypothetical protein ACXR0O_29670 [Verrucomicrobiota bacterium sgz303538]